MLKKSFLYQIYQKNKGYQSHYKKSFTFFKCGAFKVNDFSMAYQVNQVLLILLMSFMSNPSLFHSLSKKLKSFLCLICKKPFFVFSLLKN